MTDELNDEDIGIVDAITPQLYSGDSGYELPPEPYDESLISAEKRNWIPDYADQVVPEGKGFITDFVYHTRGYMIPTLACIWSALWLMSTAIKREAWIQWMPTALFPNLFTVIVGPAGRAKKTTAVTQIGLPILRKFREYLRDRNLYNMKHIAVVKDMNSPEFVIDSMLPERKPGEEFYLVDKDGQNLIDAAGKAIIYRKTSEIAIITSELSTFLSSRSYSESMSSLMLDLYDCHSDWDWGTLGRGKKTLRRMYTTFVAGTTVDGLRNSIPRAAKGDGFLSRTILVYVPDSKREYPMPRIAVGSPSMDEMSKRLAWVAEHTIGEFRLSDEARLEYERWYSWFYNKMKDNPTIEGAISRMDVHLLKTAFLIRASRYDAMGNQIELADLLDAIRLIDATYASLPLLLSQLDEDEVIQSVSKVEILIRRHDEITRQRLLIYSRLRTDTLHLVLGELGARGVVEFEFEGKVTAYSTGKPGELIRWRGEGNDGTGKVEPDRSRSSFCYTQEVRKYSDISKAAWSKPHGTPALDDGKPNYKGAVKSGRKARSPARKSSKQAKGRFTAVDKGESGGDTPAKDE
jgi:hypothetical protein